MTKEDHLRRSSHKALLIILKFIPMITALGYALNILLACFGIDAAYLIGYLTMKMYNTFRNLI